MRSRPGKSIRVARRLATVAATAALLTPVALGAGSGAAHADDATVGPLPCGIAGVNPDLTSWSAADYTANIENVSPWVGTHPATWPWAPDNVVNLSQPAWSGYSLFNSIRATGAPWSYYPANAFGQGVDVALIDSGVAPVPGLDNGNVVHGPDLSFESHSGYGHIDTYGHGTAMASIIAGRDDPNGTTSTGHLPYSYDKSSSFTGIAPGARVISLKVADSSGATDVTQVIAAIDWVVQHAHTNGFNIRVLNLSYGLQSLDAWNVDRLTTAVDMAWKNGIVVVAADGNNGTNETGVKADAGLNSPAIDKSVIAVGSYDDGGTPLSTSIDDTIPGYSSTSSSSNKRNPDIMAPGQHVLALHDVGAAMDGEIANDCGAAEGPYFDSLLPNIWNPYIQPGTATWTGPQWAANGLLMTPWRTPVAGPNNRFVRGSGTSEAAAMTSGAVALMLSKNPGLTNDQVKDILMRSAANPWGSAAGVQYRGAGELRLSTALNMTSTAQQSYSMPDGTGSFDDARGVYTPSSTSFLSGSTSTTPLPANLVAANGVVLKGDIDIFGNPINQSLTNYELYGVGWRPWGTTPGQAFEAWVGDTALKVGTGFAPDPNVGTAWASYTWPDTDFAGQSLSTINTATDPLTGHTWSGNRWSGHTWSTSDLSGNRWSGNRWSGNRWSGNSWRDASWG